MFKGNLSKFVKGNSRSRLPKVATLVAASALLVTMINLDASASPDSVGHAVILDYSGQLSGHSGIASVLQTFGRHSTTTTSSTTPLAPASGGGAIASTNATALSTTATTPSTTTPSDELVTTTTAPPTTTTSGSSPTTADTANATQYPVGTPDSSEPSGYAPPGANALPGYSQTYVEDFNGSSLPAAWGSYEGSAAGDPGGYFDQAHVTVANGMLQFNTWQDPKFDNAWVTGGACLCNIPGQVYGAYFVRSRLTGPGATQVELLMPDANVWPPEVDFNESFGGASMTSATDHYGASDSTVYQTHNVDLTQWHTWGVVWTANTIYYTLDGSVWGSVTTPGSIPDIPMHISLQQQTWCASNWACPSAPSSLDVDWVAQYGPSN